MNKMVLFLAAPKLHNQVLSIKTNLLIRYIQNLSKFYNQIDIDLA